MPEQMPDWHQRDVLQLTHRLPAEPEPKKERAVRKATDEKAVTE